MTMLQATTKSNRNGLTVGDLRQLLGELDYQGVPDTTVIAGSQYVNAEAIQLERLRMLGAITQVEDT